MRILNLEDTKKRDGVIIKALLGTSEFRQLSGYLDNLAVFSTKMIECQTKAIRTGAHHNFARYLLCPVSIRRTFKTDTHDFENIKCGAVEYKDTLFIIYSVRRKGFEIKKSNLNGNESDTN